MSQSISSLQQLVQDHGRQVEQLQEQLDRESEIRRKEDLKRMGHDPIAAHIDQKLSEEILDAITTSRFPRARLQQIARGHGIRWETLEGMANEVCFQSRGIDLESIEFEGMIAQVKHLEEQVEDPGLRAYKLQSLAKRYNRSCPQLMEAFAKALVNNPPVEPMTLRELKEANGSEIEWLFPGWLIKGTTLLLHALGGTGKTLFAYDMAEALIKGHPWQGYPTEKRKVLIVQLDEPPYATIERLEIRGIPEDEVKVLGNWQAEQLPRLASYIERERPDFVIIDSLTAINRNCCFKENDVEYARPLLHLADIASRTGTTFMIIHHSSVEGRVRGSTAIHNSVSEVWKMTHHNQALEERKLTVEKTRLGRPPGHHKFTFHPEDYSFEYDGELNGEVLMEDDTPQQEKIRLWLSEDSRRTTAFHPKEIAEALQMNDASCRRACREAFNRRLIQRRRTTKGQGYVYHVGAAQLPMGYRDDDFIPNCPPRRSGGETPDHPPIASRSLAETHTPHEESRISDRRSAKTQRSDPPETLGKSRSPIANQSNPMPAQEQRCRSASDRGAIGGDRRSLNGAVCDETVTNQLSQGEGSDRYAHLRQPGVGDRVFLAGDAYEGYMGTKAAKPLTKQDLAAKWVLRKIGRDKAEITRSAEGTTQSRKVPREWIYLYISSEHAAQL